MPARYCLRLAAAALLTLLLAGGPLALDAAAQSRGRGGTGSDSTRVRASRGVPARTAPRTERATPRTERTAPSRSRTERTTPGRTAPERAAPAVRGERAARGTTAGPATPAERRREAVRRAPAHRGDGRYDRDDRHRDDRYDRRDHRRYDRGWYRPYPVHRPAPRLHVRPGIYIDVVWPWEHRYRRQWAPRYQYRQVVHFETGWGEYHREGRLEVRTRYHERVRYASPSRAEVDVYIEAFELWAGGRYLGEVDRIPTELSRIRATVYRDGHVDFDREVFLVGDPYAGFEVISAPYYDDYILDAYDRSHRLRVGRVDFRRDRVVPVRYSRLFDPYDFDGYVPISLLPEDPGYLMDYGAGSVSSRYYGDYDDYGRYEDHDRGYDDGYYYGFEGRAAPAAPREGSEAPVLRLENDQTFETERAGAIRLRREVELSRLE